MASNNNINRGFRLVSTQNFMPAGAFNYTPPLNIDAIRVQLIAAGGGGGGITGALAKTAAGGGGGGGSSLLFWMNSTQITAALSGGVISGSVGAGGLAGSTSGGTGGTGGNTTFADWTATGGLGGVGMTAAATSQVAAGGLSQSNTVGTGSLIINQLGEIGESGYTLTTTLSNSGIGGSGALIGVTARSIIQVSTATAPGAGSGRGSGGSGGATFNNATPQTGGTGAIGLVKIEEYCYA